MFVLPDPTEAGGHEFTDPKLKTLAWFLKEDRKGLVPDLPGPDRSRTTMWKMCPGLGRPKKHHLGFLTGSERLAWMFADEWLNNTCLNHPPAPSAKSPLRGMSAVSMSVSRGTKII